MTRRRGAGRAVAGAPAAGEEVSEAGRPSTRAVRVVKDMSIGTVLAPVPPHWATTSGPVRCVAKVACRGAHPERVP